MVSDEQLKAWRALGLKSVTTADGEVFEFFPRGLLDVSTFADGEPVEAPTDRPPPAAPEDGQPNLPPAMQRVLSRKSVS